MTEEGATTVREQRRRQRQNRAVGNLLRTLGAVLSLGGAAALVIGAALPWLKFTLFGIEINVPGVVGWGAVTGVIGMLMLPGARRLPLVAVVLGLAALGVGIQAQRDVGREAVKKRLGLERALAPVNDRLAQVALPPIEPFGSGIGSARNYLGPGPLWTLWGGGVLALGGALAFTGGRMRRACGRCGTLWSEARLGEIAFCPACGFQAGPPTGCPHCGGALEHGDKFCVRCGGEANIRPT